MPTPTASSTTPTGFSTYESARLHPLTVTNWESHRRKAPRRSGNRSRITAIRVDPRIWKTALKLSGNDPRRIAVIDELTVIVLNNPRF